MKGIDLCCQQHDVNWKQVKQSGEVDFIIPRTGWGVDCDGDGIDYKFLEYVKGAQDNGISVPAVYHFIYVYCMEDAVKNAQCAIRAVQKAGLPKSTIIWCDQEEDTVIKAVKHGFNLTTDLQRKVTESFCDYVLSQGYATGVYLNQDYIVRVYGRDILTKYDIWLADLEGELYCDCLYRQYDWYGRISGIPTNVDRNTYIGIHTGQQKEVTMGKKDAFIDALKTLGDGRYHYYDGGPNSIGCSEYVRQALIRAGIIAPNEYFHAASGIRGPLDDKSRFQKIAWDPSQLQPGDILWSNGHHVAVWAGNNSVYEAAPEATHPLATCGTGVGLHKNHGYYNCGTGTYNWSNIYRIIDPDDVKHDVQEEIDMDKGFIAATLAPYMPVIRSGKKGDFVAALQRIMAKYGWYTDVIDGSCGPNTVKGIKLLQQAIGVTPDGSFGPVSWKALLD